MKITDFALIFIGVTLPIIIIVYINISFTIKALEQEMYYQKLVNSAVQDATIRMKEVENDDKENDYGYSGNINSKVSVNANIAVDTFFNSLYNNMDISGNKIAQEYLQIFVPAVAILDYNGIYISSMEEFNEIKKNPDGVETTEIVMKHKLKPKRYFTYTYGITFDNKVVESTEFITNNNNNNLFSIHTIEFSMDDFITHRSKEYITGNWVNRDVTTFYIGDDKNNSPLYDGSQNNIKNSSETVKNYVVNRVKNIRKDIIVDTIVKELSHAVNANNFYAKKNNITYNFAFPTTTKDEMYRYIENIGMLAFVQGISIGNKYLDYKAYGNSSIDLAIKYYISVPTDDSKYKRNLYHKDVMCPEYKVSGNTNAIGESVLVPRCVNTKQQAASLKATYLNADGSTKFVEGFYPCPICRP
ncbi:MAG: hypothetical protein RSC92_01435 [Clostridia bacterium]